VIGLVLAGTLAMIDHGLWAVVSQYFRSFFVWIPFQTFLQFFLPRSVHVPGAFPYPGGLTLGAALLVNLLAAHAVRFKLSWKLSGIFILHGGLIVGMLSPENEGGFRRQKRSQLPPFAGVVLHNQGVERPELPDARSS